MDKKGESIYVCWKSQVWREKISNVFAPSVGEGAF